MTRERWEALPQEERQRFAHICPDFVVELRSESDSPRKLRTRMRGFLAQGVRLGWLINPQAGQVEIYRPGRPVEVLEQPATLSGEDVLPGFVLDLTGNPVPVDVTLTRPVLMTSRSFRAVDDDMIRRP